MIVVEAIADLALNGGAGVETGTERGYQVQSGEMHCCEREHAACQIEDALRDRPKAEPRDAWQAGSDALARSTVRAGANGVASHVAVWHVAFTGAGGVP